MRSDPIRRGSRAGWSAELDPGRFDVDHGFVVTTTQETEPTTDGSTESNARSGAGPRSGRPGRKWIVVTLGVFFTALGVIGIVTPILPTTVFLLLASALFLKASPRLHDRLHNSSITGPYLRAYTAGEGLSRRRKTRTITILWVTLLVSGWFVRQTTWVLVLLAVVGIAVTVHIATIRPRRSADARGRG